MEGFVVPNRIATPIGDHGGLNGREPACVRAGSSSTPYPAWSVCRRGPSLARVDVLEEEPANSNARNLRHARERFSLLTTIRDRGLTKCSMVRGCVVTGNGASAG